MESDRFTVVQLKETSRRLGLPTKGSKAELLKRLADRDPAGAWKNVARKLQEDEASRLEEEMADETQQEEREDVNRRGPTTIFCV
ncbi:hypothetical protein ALC62_15342 [Cyphomyrmex costatus]|uniref:SAP domain-containing protein n=1 Tax=Cyphomyrmex costatus TaxID=456900 RepID=A0A151I7F0_9HYME|nr:hypothetical protein ALC62_15342 [Cyphomyrmex costatus]